MRRLILAAAIAVATVAYAGEKYLGVLIVTDAGTVSNRTTGYAAYTAAGAFVVQPPAKISIQCDQDSFVGVDVPGCDAGQCLKLLAGQLLPTSVDTARSLTGYVVNSDGGANLAITYSGGWVASAPVTGNAVSVCKVFSRQGME